VLDAYFSGTKIKWMLDHIPGAREKANAGELAFGTVDSWLLWNLTAGKVHATDVSNASRTLLFNLHTQDWDNELLTIFDIPRSMLPEIRSNSEVYGYTQELLSSASIPVAGMAGDQQSALFGQLCHAPGMVKNTYGTGCFMLMHTGNKPVASKHNLLTTVAWKINGEMQYALEGSVFIAGAVVQWLRDGLKIIRESKEIEALAASVENNGGVYLVPAFAGLGAPHWEQHARGTILGITRGSEQGHIARAALESIAYQTRDVLVAMEGDSGIPIKELRVDGGATVNNALMQFQSDMLDVTVVRPKIIETTALGAAYLAGLAVGYWESVDDLQGYWQADQKYTSTMHSEERQQHLKGWTRAVRAVLAWSKGED
ncbi:MAG: FGGY family carbohydrate kinase, partial [Sphingobacteriales bacterium]